MRKTLTLSAPIRDTLRQVVSVGLVAMLLVGALFVAQPGGKVSASTCVSTQDGDWSSPATWTGCLGGIPTTVDDVTINHSVTVSNNQSVNNVTIAFDEANGFYGVLSFAALPATLSIRGNLDVQPSALFSPTIVESDTGEIVGGGKVLFNGVDQVINTHGAWVDFWDLEKSSNVAASLSVDPAVAGEGGIHILNDLTLLGTASAPLALKSTTPGSPWQILPEWDQTIVYVAVEDSANVSGEVPTIFASNSTDLGGNSGWDSTTAPAIEVASDANPVGQSEFVTFTATITPADATGTVDFRANGVFIPNCVAVPVNAGAAVCTTDRLPTNTYMVTASYSGDGTHIAGAGNLFQVVSNRIWLSLDTAVKPAAADGPVKLEANITPRTTVGSVNFFANVDPATGVGDLIAECAGVGLVNGKAVCNAVLPAGANNLRAEFVEGAVSSNVMGLAVKNLSTVTLETSHAFASYNQEITFTAKVTAPAGAQGTFTFMDRNTVLAGCANVAVEADGSAVCTVKGLTPGLHLITVGYSGDATTFGMQPMAIQQNVDLVWIYMPIVGRN